MCSESFGVCDIDFASLNAVVLDRLRMVETKSESELTQTIRAVPDYYDFNEFFCEDIDRLVVGFDFKVWTFNKFVREVEEKKDSFPWNLVGEDFRSLKKDGLLSKQYSDPIEAYRDTEAKYFLFLEEPGTEETEDSNRRTCLVVEIESKD